MAPVVLGGGRRALVAAMVVAALSMGMVMGQQDEDDVLLGAGGGVYQPRDPCPQVEDIVKAAVKAEFKNNKDITGGFLRAFFHDCFSGGCDASIFLDKEWRRFPVQERVRQFVNEIRGKVNEQCGNQSVSCADILALGTRDAVVEAGGPTVRIFRGRFDSKTDNDVSKIPFPGDAIADLLKTFAGFGLTDPADLVALSGAHTVGKTRNACGFANPKFRGNCMSTGSQDLDVLTPVSFDNQYYVGLTQNPSLGMFSTDRDLFSDANPTTKKLVQLYAKDQNAFFKQWDVSFRKLSHVNWTSAAIGEIRRDCTKVNTGRLSSIIGQEGAADQ